MRDVLGEEEETNCPWSIMGGRQWFLRGPFLLFFLFFLFFFAFSWTIVLENKSLAHQKNLLYMFCGICFAVEEIFLQKESLYSPKKSVLQALGSYLLARDH